MFDHRLGKPGVYSRVEDRKQMRREYFRTLRGDFCQKPLHFDVGEDHVGLTLEGFVVAPFKSISFFRGADEGSGFNQKVLHLNKRELRLIIQEFVNTDDQLRERVKPGKPRIVQHQVQEFAG